MKARDLMTANPISVTGDEPISRAAQLMRDWNIGLLPVVDDRAHMHLRGVITDRDIAVRCVAERHPEGCDVERHMSQGHLVSVAAGADVSEVMRVMEREQVRRVPITEGGRLVGIVAQADLALKEGPLEPLRVEEVLERISSPKPMVV